MEYIGIDVHKRESQICILDDGGTVREERRILSARNRFAAIFGTRPRARIVLEASTESEWVAQCLEELGHEVIVADPNYAPMYATRTRRVKTDRRDARTLAECSQAGRSWLRGVGLDCRRPEAVHQRAACRREKDSSDWTNLPASSMFLPNAGLVQDRQVAIHLAAGYAFGMPLEVFEKSLENKKGRWLLELAGVVFVIGLATDFAMFLMERRHGRRAERHGTFRKRIERLVLWMRWRRRGSSKSAARR